MKLLAFAASSSAQSINKALATHAASLVEGASVEILDINDYEMPIFSTDREAELGHPEQAQAFFKKIGEADAIIVSFAEHNGSYTAAYKNLFDWTSRIEQKVYQGKPVVYLATSPGPGGAQTVLNSAVTSAPYFGVDLKGSLSVPSFYDNFDMEAQKLNNAELLDALKTTVNVLAV
ncbi:NADPH-dependent FMN reductase [Enterovibrio nigricans]|uniref:NAD(P)H-dependent FMN reductase n=1 Tax=Enterovibrio nigricans DSM 22720 TaxID=1121868 RepID=A0A1T4W0A3_9GAMM|nr:NAD(P)H-dependent oxidoreductase [Enterovibrio nigricans]SKA70704.1 NAD(P)H-dependent FMN reductase [Enterovibrio nigricans DSM 22720]